MEVLVNTDNVDITKFVPLKYNYKQDQPTDNLVTHDDATTTAPKDQ